MRIKGVDPANPPDSVAKAFQKQTEMFGHVLTPGAVMAHRPGSCSRAQDSIRPSARRMVEGVSNLYSTRVAR